MAALRHANHTRGALSASAGSASRMQAAPLLRERLSRFDGGALAARNDDLRHKRAEVVMVVEQHSRRAYSAAHGSGATRARGGEEPHMATEKAEAQQPL